jgi:N-acetylmuramoyl-L-alanine amidase
MVSHTGITAKLRFTAPLPPSATRPGRHNTNTPTSDGARAVPGSQRGRIPVARRANTWAAELPVRVLRARDGSRSDDNSKMRLLCACSHRSAPAVFLRVKSANFLFLLLVLMVTEPARLLGAPRNAAPTPISPPAYVRLTDWAKANHLEVQWLKPNETLQLSNSSSKLMLSVDSREARINGVMVWLLYPITAHSGIVRLAEADVDLTLRPLLALPRGRAGGRIKHICLDPGHGGKDPGNRVGSNQEKQYTLLLAEELRSQLARAGFKVSLTRSKDEFIELPRRPELAKHHSADVYVSLHFNAVESGRGSVQGAEVYCLTPAGASSTNARGEGATTTAFPGNRHNDLNLYLAYEMQKALTQGLPAEDRGVRRARFAVLRDAAMPAVLVEAGFMSNPSEAHKIFSAAYRLKIARAIVEGLLAYKRAAEQKA